MPALSLNPSAQGSESHWLMGDSGLNDPPRKLIAVTDNSDAPAGLIIPSSPAEAESWYFGDVSDIAPATPVTRLLLRAKIAAPFGDPFYSAALTLAVRIGSGAWELSAPILIPPNGNVVLEWEAPRPGGGMWSIADMNDLEARALLTWVDTEETQPFFSKVWADITYTAVPTSYEAGREVAGRSLRLFRRIVETVRIDTPALWPLDIELLEDLAVTHFAANTADGKGWGERRWQRGLLHLLSTEIDLDRLTMSLECLNVRPYRVAFWDTMVSDVASGFLGQGVARLSFGEKRTFARASRAWIPNPGDPRRVVEVAADVEKITSGGTLFERWSRNDQLHSSFGQGLTGWAKYGAGTVTPSASDPLFEDGAQRLTFVAGNPIATDLEVVGLATAPYEAGTVACVSVDHRDDSGPPLYWALQRGADGWWWRDADSVWVGSKAWNALPVAAETARHASRAIGVGTLQTALTIRLGVPAIGTPGQVNQLYNVQIEPGRYPTSRIVTEGEPVERAADSLVITNRHGQNVWPSERGSAFLQFTPMWATGDLTPGSIRTLLEAWSDPDEYDCVFYDRDSASLVFRRRNGLHIADAAFPLAIERDRTYGVALRWTGDDGELDLDLDLDPHTLSILVDGERGTDAVALGSAASPEDGEWRIGGDRAANAADCALMHLTTSPFVLSDAELRGLP